MRISVEREGKQTQISEKRKDSYLQLELYTQKLNRYFSFRDMLLHLLCQLYLSLIVNFDNTILFPHLFPGTLLSCNYNQNAKISVITQSMNIQNLLKRIEERRDKQREFTGAISSERIAKINYDDTDNNHVSIGTVNEMPNTQNDRSYFKQYFENFATEQDKEQSSQAEGLQSNVNKSNKLERIECELDDIEKMKSLFENKKKLDPHGSIQRNCVNKSVEKHTLKPCQVPKFKQTSEFMINPTDSKEQSHSYTFKDESFANNINKAEVISFKGAEIFDDSQQDSKRSISLQNDESWTKSKPEFHNLKPQKCICESTLRDFMSDVGQKMSLLTQRISQLEQSNFNIKLKHQKVITSNAKAMQILQKLEEQKNELVETQDKWTKSKVQLQTLLKDVTVKKQKEGSKENMSKQDCQNYFKHRDKSKSPLKTYNFIEQKKGNKNKVENLLQRLQLRVQKS